MRAIRLQHGHIHIEIVLGGDRVEDKVEAVGGSLYLLGVRRDEEVLGAQLFRILFLGGGGAHDRDVRAKGYGELHAHMTEAAQTDDGYLMSLADLPVTERGVGRDARTKQGRCCGQVEFVGDVQDKVFVNYDGL